MHILSIAMTINMQKSVKFGEKWVFNADFMESDIYVLQKSKQLSF